MIVSIFLIVFLSLFFRFGAILKTGLLGIFAVSCTTGEGIKEFSSALENHIYGIPSVQIPASYLLFERVLKEYAQVKETKVIKNKKKQKWQETGGKEKPAHKKEKI